MDVKIDVSEHVRFIEKDSVLGVATEDGQYKKNVCLYPRVKRRINHYSDKIDKVHSIMLFILIKDDVNLYNSIHICCDVSRNKLINDLRKLFKGDPYWSGLEKSGSIRVYPVKKAYVDMYVNRVRKNKEPKGMELDLETMDSYLRIFSDDEEKYKRKERKAVTNPFEGE
ncbi:hypothetical protein HYS31_07930 [Candidatus Woesearchaeota archaeon]|nr:hypothetical protein [Candidatus Woesearchaeota archaeon]